MKTIPISGVIGWDVSPKDVRAALDSAAGEDVEVQISSPGGMALEAFEIYNLIRNYKGPKVARLMGVAASAASYIAMSADRVIGEDNVVFMIHNAQGGAMGDHNTMKKAASILEGLSGIIAQAYSRKSGKSLAEINSIMDEQGWYFGAEAKDAGFVDEIVPAPADAQKDKAAAFALTKAQVQACRKIISEVETVETLTEAAAMVPALKITKPAGVAGDKTAAQADGTLKTGGAKKMTLEELKRDNPALYAEATADARQAGKVEGNAEGVTQERKRLEQLNAFRGKNADGDKAVDEAIRSGAVFADVAPLIAAAVMNGNGKNADGDNPADVATAAQLAAGGAGMSAEDKAWYVAHGVKPDEMAKIAADAAKEA
jgi:ATP-dependent protease ClpP protease subunit